MSIDKAVDSTQLNADLTSVANAIRTKGGTSAQLAFPAGFVQAIGDIETGGDNAKYLNLIARTGTEFEDSDVITTGRGAFSYWTALQSLSLPNLETIGDGCFQGSNAISNFYFPKATTIAAGNAFSSAGAITSAIVLPLLSAYPSNNAINAFRGQAIDLGKNIGDIKTYMFQSSSNLTKLILRKTSVSALVNINAFNNTPFASGKSGGTLYVPQAQIVNYQAATNWDTLLSYPNNQILPIEGSIYETQYADGTPITT